MTFRKDDVLYHETTVCYVASFLLGLVIALLTGIYFLSPLFSMFIFVVMVLPSGLLLRGNKKSFKEQVTINECGIACKEEGKLLWEYPWEQIAELRRGTRFRHPSIEVIPWDKATGKPAAVGAQGAYFLLGKEAKNALSKYYKGNIYWIGSSKVYSLPKQKRNVRK